MNFDFYMPVRVVSGRTALADSAAQLKKLGDSCMVVTGKHSAKASGALDDLTEVLRREKISCTVYDGITENPLLSSCEEAAALAAEKKAAFVVGIGGGSPLDAAKAIAALAANPGLDREGFFKKAWKNPPLPIVLIGTTSGTGSEVSPTSVLTVDGVKKSVSGPELYASLAIANPAYTGTMSYNTTVSTGLDAFCHAVEGYFSPACDDITGYLAEKAMPMVYWGLKMMRPEMEMTPAFREQMYYGSLWAGLVLNAHGTSFPHPYGYVLTENHGIPHGKACAVFLPALLLHCAQYAPEKMERFLRVLDTDLPAVNQLLDSLSGVERISMTKEEIQSYRKRFTGLKHYANTPGAYSEEQGLRLFETLFLK